MKAAPVMRSRSGGGFDVGVEEAGEGGGIGLGEGVLGVGLPGLEEDVIGLAAGGALVQLEAGCRFGGPLLVGGVRHVADVDDAEGDVGLAGL